MTRSTRTTKRRITTGKHQGRTQSTHTHNTPHTHTSHTHTDSHEMQIIAFIEYRSINRIYVCMRHACMHTRNVNTSQFQLTTKSQSIIDISACLQECMHVIRNPISCTIDYHWTIPIPCGATTCDETERKIHAPLIRWLIDSESGSERLAVVSRSLECVNFAAANKLTSYQSTHFCLHESASFFLSKKDQPFNTRKKQGRTSPPLPIRVDMFFAHYSKYWEEKRGIEPG